MLIKSALSENQKKTTTTTTAVDGDQRTGPGMDREQTSTRSTDCLLTFRETHMTGLQPTQQYCTTSSL